MPIVRLQNLEQFAAVNLTSDPGAIGGPVQIPSCAQIGIVWSLTNGRVAHNVMYGRYAGAFSGTATQANSILTQLSTGATFTALATFMATTGRIAQVTIRDVNQPEQALIVATGGTQGPGTSTGTALPDEVAAVVTLQTGFSGPQNRGRVYVPNWASNAVGTGGVIAPGAVTALANWATTNLLPALSAQGYTPVIGQKARQAYVGSTGTQHPARAAGSVDITTAVVRDNHWDTQRKRGLR